MANFCIHCGTPLQEGIACACQTAQTTVPPQQVPVEPVTPQPVQEQPVPEQPVPEQAAAQQQAPVYTQPVPEQQAPPVQPYIQQSYVQQPYTQPSYGQQPVQQPMYQQPVYAQQPIPGQGYEQQVAQGQAYAQQAYTQQDAYGQAFHQQQQQQQQYTQQGAPQPGYQQQAYGQQSYQHAHTAPNYAQYQQQFDTFKKDSGVYLKKLYVQFMKIIKAPVSEGQTYLEKGNLSLSCGLLTIQALLSAIFTMIVLGKYNDAVVTEMKDYGEYISGYLFSLPKAFILTVIFSLVLSAARAGLLFLAGKIQKSTASYETMLHLTAIGTVIASPVLAISIVLLFVNVIYAVAFFSIATIASFVAIIVLYTHAAKVNSNLLIWMLFGVILAYSVVSSILFKNAVSLYLPSELKNAYKQSSDYLEMIKKYGSFL